VDKIPSDEIAPILEAVCGKGNVLTKQDEMPKTKPMQQELGCKLCPAYTNEAGHKPTIGAPVMGAYTGPGRTEALVDLSGCEAHANSSGGTVLLRREQGRWKRISYLGGIRAHTCLTLRRNDGKDLFVCTESDMFQGHVFTAVTAYWFTERGVLEDRNRLLTSIDNLSACLGNGRLKAMEVQEVKPRDMNNDGKQDVVIGLSAAFARIPKRGGDPCLTEKEVKALKPISYQLVYLFDGNSLTASLDSRKALKEMDAKRSDILGEPIDEQSARAFIEYWLKTSQDNGNLDEVMNSYSDAVDFYKFGLVEENVIRQDKQKYYSRWPKRKYELKSFALSPGERRHEAKVVITFTYEISNEKKSLKGEAKAVLTLQSNDEGISIIGEREQ
jgi:hypothetical protein